MLHVGSTTRDKRKIIIVLALGLISLVSSQVISLNLSYVFNNKYIYEKYILLKNPTETIKLNLDVIHLEYEFAFQNEKPTTVNVTFKGEHGLVLTSSSYLLNENKTISGELYIDGTLDSVEISIPGNFEAPCHMILRYTKFLEIYYILTIAATLLGVVGVVLFILGLYYAALTWTSSLPKN